MPIKAGKKRGTRATFLFHFLLRFNFASDLFSRLSAKKQSSDNRCWLIKIPKIINQKWKPESKRCCSQNRQNRNFLSIHSHLPFVSYVSFCWKHMIQFWLHWWHRLLCMKREVLMSHVCWVDLLIATVLHDLFLRTGAAWRQLCFDCTQTCGCHTLPWISKWELAPEEHFPFHSFSFSARWSFSAWIYSYFW